MPTPDGGHLDRLRDSLKNQLRDGDEVIVVGDTHTHDLTPVQEWVEQQPHWRWAALDAGVHAWGHPQVNYGMQLAQGDWLLFQDDDDIYTGGALQHVRRRTRQLKEPAPQLYRFISGRVGKVWRVKGHLAMGWVGGHCMVVPNVKEKLGLWTDRYEGDWDFIESTLEKWKPIEPVWQEEIIVAAR